MVGRQTFRFLNRQHTLGTSCGWASGEAALWHYQLNYFGDLLAEDAEKRTAWHQALITQWIDENPPGSKVSWAPYPTSLRIVNWIKWFLLGHRGPENFLSSLEQQARWLNRNLEWHLLGNHLLANAKALIFAGTFFQGAASQRWLAKGIKIMSQQLREQTLSDGGHFELSPMYHAIIVEDLQDLLQLQRCFPGCLGASLTNQIDELLPQMLQWLAVMSHPDGEISYFNDAVVGGAPRLELLLRHCEPRRGEAIHERLTVAREHVSHGLLRCFAPRNDLTIDHLKASGYIALHNNHLKAILDVGQIGPDYLPGHAHADTLSFELSLGRERIFVNSGTSIYQPGSERLQERATAAHNTVEVNKQNSSEIWGSFRVARRAYPEDLHIEKMPGQIKVRCSHNGYDHLARGLRHQRQWALTAENLLIRDVVFVPRDNHCPPSPCDGAFPAVAYYHLHPDVRIIQLDSQSFALTTAGEHTVQLTVLQGKPRLSNTEYALEFGKKVPNKCLEIQLVTGSAVLQLSHY